MAGVDSAADEATAELVLKLNVRLVKAGVAPTVLSVGDGDPTFALIRLASHVPDERAAARGGRTGKLEPVLPYLAKQPARSASTAAAPRATEARPVQRACYSARPGRRSSLLPD